MGAGYRLDIPDAETANAAPLDMPLLGRPPSRLRDCEVLTIPQSGSLDCSPTGRVKRF